MYGGEGEWEMNGERGKAGNGVKYVIPIIREENEIGKM